MRLFRLVLLLTLLLALVFSSLSLFKVTHEEQYLPQYHQKFRIKGADILCDSRLGSDRSSCKGDYFRGWPFHFGKGQVVGRVENRHDEHFEIDFEFALYNTLAWLLPSSLLVTPITLWLAKEEL